MAAFFLLEISGAWRLRTELLALVPQPVLTCEEPSTTAQKELRSVAHSSHYWWERGDTQAEVRSEAWMKASKEPPCCGAWQVAPWCYAASRQGTAHKHRGNPPRAPLPARNQ